MKNCLILLISNLQICYRPLVYEICPMKTVSPKTDNLSTTVLLRIPFIISTIVTIFIFSKNIEAAEKNFPFYPGEKLTFQLKWTLIPAGEGILEVLPIETINGVKAYHFVLTAKSNSFVDLFYKVRDRIDAYTDIEMNHTILYKKKQREGKTQKDVGVVFEKSKNAKIQVWVTADKRRMPVKIKSKVVVGSFVGELVSATGLEK